MTHTRRLSYSLKEGPSFLRHVFFERTGNLISIGVDNRNGQNYALIEMPRYEFEAMVVQLLEGLD